MSWLRITHAANIPLREGRAVTVEGGEEIALFNTDGEIYAIGDVCTHAYTHLTEGDFYEDIRGWVVECPLHGSQFDVTTGDAVTLPATGNAGKYDVKIVGDEILVGVPPVVRFQQ